jgi:hypothetical protein
MRIDKTIKTQECTMMPSIVDAYNKLNELGWIEYSKSSITKSFHDITGEDLNDTFIELIKYFTNLNSKDDVYSNYVAESNKSPIYIENDTKLVGILKSNLSPNIYQDIIMVNINNLYPKVMIHMGDYKGRYNYPIHVALESAINYRSYCKSNLITGTSNEIYHELYNDVQYAIKYWLNHLYGIHKSIDLKFTYGVNQGIRVECENILNDISSIFSKGIGYVDTDTIFFDNYTSDEWYALREYAKKSRYDIEVCKTTISYKGKKRIEYLNALNNDGVKAYAYDNDISNIINCDKTEYSEIIGAAFVEQFTSKYTGKWMPMIKANVMGGNINPGYYEILAESLERQSISNRVFSDNLIINNDFSVHEVVSYVVSASLNLIRYMMSTEGIGSQFIDHSTYSPDELILEFTTTDLNNISSKHHTLKHGGVQLLDIFIDELHSLSIVREFRGIRFDFSHSNSIKVYG